MRIEESYIIKNALGAGSSGTVMRVATKGGKTEYALKIIYLAGKKNQKLEKENFVAELDTLKNLTHPNIGLIHDAGFDAERNALFIAAELIEGQDLFESTKNMDYAGKEELFVQSLRALNYLNEKGVNHFDIKPQNMLVTQLPNPVLKLIDFGLANFYNRHSSSSDSPIYAGTFTYIAPEILNSQKPDQRADLYSLGVSFFKIFCRKLPFTALSQEEAKEAHLNQIFPLPSHVNNTLPSYLDKIFSKLFEKKPSQRYQSAAEVIHDLSLLSGKNYEIETTDTALSYIPEKGSLVCREHETSQIETLFKDRILSEKFNEPPVLVIHGSEGTGKTRLLEEMRHLAQKNMVDIVSLEAFNATPINEIKTPAILLVDQNIIDESLIQFVTMLFSKRAFLLVLTSKEAPSINFKLSQIELENFSLNQIEIYLKKVSGIESFPSKIVQTIFAHTQGNPRFLAEYTAQLFEKGLLRDSHGKWSPNILEDIGLNLEKQNLSGSIKNRLKNKLEQETFSIHQWDILKMLALTGKPTIQDLMELSQPSSIQDDLNFLEQKNIIHREGAAYHFTNPLYAEVVVEMMDNSDTETRSDKIADYLEQQIADRELVMYHRGHGKTEQAIPCLIQLATIKKEKFLFEEAIDILELLLKKRGLTNEQQIETIIKLSELHLEIGNIQKVRDLLTNIFNEKRSVFPEKFYAKAIELFGLTSMSLKRWDEAKDYFKQHLLISQQNPKIGWMGISAKNNLARVEYGMGNIEKALQIMEATLEEWRRLPDENLKVKTTQSDIDSVYYLKGEFKKAISILEEQLQIFSKNQNSSLYPVLLYKLGRLYIQQNNIEKGEALLKQCLQVVKNRGTVYWLNVVYNELGNSAMNSKKMDNALYYYFHAFSLAKRKQDSIQHLMIAYNIANIYLEMQNFDEAEKYFLFVKMGLEKTKTGEEAKIYFHILGCLLGLSTIFRKQNKLSDANQFLDQAETYISQKKYLSRFQQYFLQEKYDLAQAMRNQELMTKILMELEQLKSTDEFSMEEYGNWQKRAGISS
ncbi:protein kinase [bacterium]|nr:protein kinase [bacterium]